MIFPDANLMEGTTFGGELAAEWQSAGGRRRLRSPTHSYLHAKFDIPPESNRESAKVL